ncbi:CHASE2 domain-containing protein [Sphingopyxis sp.]|uniref:CHASE2 domain-containing protein n=1 Tax=Sphingopyxis sp. TaxID=1908224 RepID=UPI002D77FEA5|nr:CHASE2 domain-containing protein [Sphingopyxis sp.]HET6523568.1 CHASE2 domain-containing protein [Sphingopyxis sp.]
MSGEKSRTRLKVEWGIILLAASLLVGWMSADRSLLRFDNLIYDHLLQASRPASSGDIILVAIDDESLRRVGRWPWPRETHARLVDAIAKTRPRAIGYDILFSEPADAAGDASLGAAMRRAGNVYAPLSFAAPGRNGAGFDILAPIGPVREGAAGIGHVNLSFDPDGTVRRFSSSFGDSRHRWWHLAELVHAGPRREPSRAPGAPILIPFAGPAGHWPTVPAAAVLAGEVPPEFLRGKYIMVGATANALGAGQPVPAGERMPGVEIQAHILNGLITGRAAREAGIPAMLCFGLIPLWMAFLAYRYLPSRAAAFAAAIMILAVFLTAAGALILFGLWIPPAVAIAGLVGSYPLWAWRQLASADKFMRTEIDRFRSDPRWLPEPEMPLPPGGQLESTIGKLRLAISNARELRHFALDRLDQLPDAILVTDREGYIVLSNAAAAALFGSLGTSIAEGDDCLALFACFHLDPSRDPLPVTREKGQLKVDCGDLDAATAEGHFYSVRFASQSAATGEQVGWLIRLLDVSESRASQRQRDDIVQLLTHDMRSPQASIMALLDSAASEQIDPGFAARIRHYAQRTLGLADGFVQLARAESLKYAMEEIDFNDILMDAIDELWPQMTAKQIRAETLGGEERILVEGERSLLTRALVNIIDNAVKYSPPGTCIRCTLRREPAPGGGWLAQCTVEDEGPGLPADRCGTIFERFERGPLGIGHKIEGVGLGLSFVHTVMVRHKGEVRCVSEPGQGARFTLTLPALA